MGNSITDPRRKKINNTKQWLGGEGIECKNKRNQNIPSLLPSSGNLFLKNTFLFEDFKTF
jgi:hypothetical protein